MEQEVTAAVESSRDGQPHLEQCLNSMKNDEAQQKLCNPAIEKGRTPMTMIVHLSLNDIIIHWGGVSLTE